MHCTYTYTFVLTPILTVPANPSESAGRRRHAPHSVMVTCGLNCVAYAVLSNGLMMPLCPMLDSIAYAMLPNHPQRGLLCSQPSGGEKGGRTLLR